jgi:hypothetical protein
MTLHPGKPKLYVISHMVWLTDKEKEELENIHREYGVEMIFTEQKT